MTTLFYKALILQGEIWCWSPLGLFKGLRQCFVFDLMAPIGVLLLKWQSQESRRNDKNKRKQARNKNDKNVVESSCSCGFSTQCSKNLKSLSTAQIYQQKCF